MPKWHKIRRKKPGFGAILCQNGTRLMPKWHSQNACMSNFCQLWQSGEEAAKKGAVPTSGDGMATSCNDGFSPSCWGTIATCGDGPCSRAFVRLGRGTEVYLAAVRTCVHDKQALFSTSGEASPQVSMGYPPGLYPQVGTLFPTRWGNRCSQLQRADSLCKMPEPAHTTGSDPA